MQATHGLAELFRLRARVIAIAFGLALSVLLLALASSARAAEPPHKTYLGSGTSIAFGYSQELFNENFPTENPANFEEANPAGSGIPNGVVLDYYHLLQAAQSSSSTWTRLTNDGCPGETSRSYIGNGNTGKTLEAIIAGSHGEEPCAYHNVNGFELHHPYKAGKDFPNPSKAESQLENVLETIQIQNTGNNATHHPVQAITLDLGANDILAVVKLCEKEVAEGKWPGNPEANIPPLTECEVAHLPASIKELATQVSAVLFAIRNGSLLCFADCDEGDQGVNYNGKIVFAGFYNPFGSVITPGVELNPGSNFLDIVINIVMAKTVANFGVCYANPQRSPANHAHAFNPLINGEPLLEPGRLQAWTNMANTTTAVGGNKQANGPDIHPTPAGYQVSAEIYKEECP